MPASARIGGSDRIGVGMAGEFEVPADLLHRDQHMGDALAQADDRDPAGHQPTVSACLAGAGATKPFHWSM